MTMLWLLLRVRWRRAFAPSLAVALLIGIVGGFVLASAAAARRVENAYRVFAEQVDVPDLGIIPAVDCGEIVGGCDRPPEVTSADEVLAALRSLEVVEKARLVESIIPYIIDDQGTAVFGNVDNVNGCFDGNRSLQMVATAPGTARDQVVPFLLEGDLPSPGSGNVVITRSSAGHADLVVGDRLLLAGLCSGDGDPIEFASPIELRVSGLSIGPLDVESPGATLTIQPAFVDPTVFQAMVAFGAEPQQNVTVWLNPTASLESIDESLSEYQVILDFRERQTVFDDALRTDANLLWLLAAVGAFAALLVVSPLIARNLRDTGPDVDTLSALGTRRQQITQQAIAHSCSLAAIGAASAAIAAVPISAFMPSGLASALQPNREFWFDAVLTSIGVMLLVAVVLAIGAIPAWRIGRVERSDTTRTSELAAAGGLLHLRPAARSGVAAAVGASVGPRQASPWPSLVSMVVAATVGVASLTYLAGLRHLERTPRLVGWNWDAAVSFDFGQGESARAAEIIVEIGQLDAVDTVTGGTLWPPSFLFVEGTDVSVWPWSFATGPDAIQPSMLNGRAPEGPDEVAVDGTFAEQAALDIGDTVNLARPTLVTVLATDLQGYVEEFGLDYQLADVPEQAPVVAEFEITGIAVLPSDPAQEISNVSLTLAGYAALVEPPADEVAAAQAWLPDDLPPELGFVVDGVLSNLGIDNRVAYLRFSGSVEDGAAAVLNIKGVPEVVAPTPTQVLSLMVGLNIDRNDRVPIALAIMVAFAFLALATYLLVYTVRARRFEFAVMRALGLSATGVRWSIAAQATATAVVALAIAVPIGLVTGRWAWLNYARELGIQPVATLPWSQVAVACLVVLAFVNVVAVVPGWIATRRSAGLDLRSE